MLTELFVSSIFLVAEIVLILYIISLTIKTIDGIKRGWNKHVFIPIIVLMWAGNLGFLLVIIWNIISVVGLIGIGLWSVVGIIRVIYNQFSKQ